MGNAGGVEVVQPDRGDGMAGISQPGEAMAGKHYTPIAIAEGAFCAGSINAARLWDPRCHRVLAAQPVLQQNQLGTWGQAWRQLRHSLFGVVGFAGDQQSIDGGCAVGCFRGHRVTLCFAMFDQCQPTSRLVSL
ncbi:hypothetical protein D3C71_1699470 [compost metagenome]